MIPQISWISREGDYPQICREIREDLLEETPFVLWLTGDLGAGKTTFSGVLLHEFGLSHAVPVLSPTFTYLTEYDTPIGRIAHMDLYRLVAGDSDSVETLLSGRTYRGLIVEWPEKACDAEAIAPTRILRITSDDDTTHRLLSYGRR